MGLHGGNKMESTAWTGNITMKIDGKEDTYSPAGSVTVERYSEGAYTLKLWAGAADTV